MIQHQIRPFLRQLCGRLPKVGFLGQDPDTTATQILDYPGMVYV